MKIYTASEVIALRAALGMNQRDFWECFGTTQSGGSRYESEREIPRPVQLLLNAAFGDLPDGISRLRKRRRSIPRYSAVAKAVIGND